MNFKELRLPQEIDKSFVVFKEVGKYFPCPWHYHPEYEIVQVTRSWGRRMVGDNIGQFNEGDLVLMGPFLPHVWVNDAKYINNQVDGLAEAIVIHFKNDFLGKCFLTIPEMSSLKTLLKLSNRGLSIRGKAKEDINNIMREMVNMNGIQRLSKLFSIFDILSEQIEFDVLASPAYVEKIHNNESDRLNIIIQYVLKNFDEEISLPIAASMMNMGLTTFCNFFKANYRITFVEYVNSVRIGHACKMLLEKDYTISEVAYKSGYNSIANFNRQFKKYKKLNPSEFKRMVNI